MKTTGLILMFAVFVVTASPQKGKQQSSFGSEVENERPAGVPTYFLNLLTIDEKQRLMRCQRDKEISYLHKDKVLDHFTGSQLDVKTSNGITNLLIVKSNSLCFDGAHNSRFWILAKRNGKTTKRYKTIFDGQVDGLDIATKTKSRYPDIEVFSHTAVEGFTSTVKYLRGRYRTTSCYVEAIGDDQSKRRRVPCSKYNWEFRK